MPSKTKNSFAGSSNDDNKNDIYCTDTNGCKTPKRPVKSNTGNLSINHNTPKTKHETLQKAMKNNEPKKGPRNTIIISNGMDINVAETMLYPNNDITMNCARKRKKVERIFGDNMDCFVPL
mmetsp:Transcript_25814/g.38137  ORF Transcript_25814/g.38137 Transcript_25814/m.38137 type:complete len:121 (-) Transcript_25814:240-602(-)